MIPAFPGLMDEICRTDPIDFFAEDPGAESVGFGNSGSKKIFLFSPGNILCRSQLPVDGLEAKLGYGDISLSGHRFYLPAYSGIMDINIQAWTISLTRHKNCTPYSFVALKYFSVKNKIGFPSSIQSWFRS